MYKLKYKKLHKLLKNNSLIANSVTETLYALNNIEQFLYAELPSGVREHVKPLNISGHTLVLETTTPALKSKLRYLTPELEKRLRHHTSNQLNRLVIKVIPNKGSIKKPSAGSKQRPPMSSNSRSIIESFADNIDDPKLKSSLLRLSKNATRK